MFFGFERSQVSHPLDGLGYLSTRGSNQIITGAQFCSTMFPGRAPARHVAIACYVGGARTPDLTRLPSRDIVVQTYQELSSLLGIKGKPALEHLRIWPRGLPQYTPGHHIRRRTIETANERIEGLFLIGNYLGGVSVANCLATAQATAARIDAMHPPGTHSVVGQDESTMRDIAEKRIEQHRVG